MATVVVDVPSKNTGPGPHIIKVPLDGELYLHFKEDVTFCNNNRDCFEPYLPCNIYFKAGDAWGPAVPVPDKDGVDVGYSWMIGHGKCPPCEPAHKPDVVFDGGGHFIHVGS